MRSYWIRWGFHPMIGVLSKREKFGHRDTEGKDKYVKTEAET